MTRENGQTKKTSRNYERERALDMCARMSAAEWDVIRAMPPSAKIASPDVEYWIRQGWVSRVDNWFMLTLAGKRARWSSATPTNAKDWIDVLTCIPGYGVLTRLLSEGIITNEGGFPMLSHFGRVVQQELRGGDIYFATRHTFLEG